MENGYFHGRGDFNNGEKEQEDLEAAQGYVRSFGHYICRLSYFLTGLAI